jgi:hypothetical protein
LWHAGKWTEGCVECGGGALEIDCLICRGRCGSKWERAVLDSNDFGDAHWFGICRLSKA